MTWSNCCLLDFNPTLSEDLFFKNKSMNELDIMCKCDIRKKQKAKILTSIILDVNHEKKDFGKN